MGLQQGKSLCDYSIVSRKWEKTLSAEEDTCCLLTEFKWYKFWNRLKLCKNCACAEQWCSCSCLETYVSCHIKCLLNCSVLMESKVALQIITFHENRFSFSQILFVQTIGQRNFNRHFVVYLWNAVSSHHQTCKWLWSVVGFIIE